MPSSPQIGTAGAKGSPLQLFEDAELLEKAQAKLSENDYRNAIITAFSLPPSDNFVYHANASITLIQAQNAVEAKGTNGLHDWYRDPSGQTTSNPPLHDIEAYIALFSPKNSFVKTLKSLSSNAKKDSIRQHVAEYLTDKRYLDERFTIPKAKNPKLNPYFEFWAWSCRSLEWAGPVKESSDIKISHHVLPMLMHHFGCVVPSHEALEILRQVSNCRNIIDMGSGNGYWSLMLRNTGLQVTAVDSRQSEYRTTWIGDTIVAEGVGWLKSRSGAKDDVLLLVYPITAGGVTEKILNAYQGDTVCVAGTQNKNGYTGFKDKDIAEWMEQNRTNFEKTAQVPLPSFAGKDEALFVFQKKN